MISDPSKKNKKNIKTTTTKKNNQKKSKRNSFENHHKLKNKRTEKDTCVVLDTEENIYSDHCKKNKVSTDVSARKEIRDVDCNTNTRTDDS